MKGTRSALAPTEYADYYAGYLSAVPEDLQLATVLEESVGELTEWLKHVNSREGELYAYAPGKWTVVQSLQHIIDTERIFSYRALCFARGESQPLPGFDQNEYAAVAGPDNRPLSDLFEELELVRASTRYLFKGMTDEELLKTGSMSGYVHSVRAIGFIIAGHSYHHARIYRDFYGKAQRLGFESMM